MKYKVGQKFILHSENGLNYDVVIYNVNEYRKKPYAVDVYLEETNVYDDVVFVDEGFLDGLEKIDESTTEGKEV